MQQLKPGAPERTSAQRPWEWSPTPVVAPKLAGILPVDVTAAEAAAGRTRGDTEQARLLVNEFGIPAIEFI